MYNHGQRFSASAQIMTVLQAFSEAMNRLTVMCGAPLLIAPT